MKLSKLELSKLNPLSMLGRQKLWQLLVLELDFAEEVMLKLDLKLERKMLMLQRQ